MVKRVEDLTELVADTELLKVELLRTMAKLEVFADQLSEKARELSQELTTDGTRPSQADLDDETGAQSPT